MKVLLATTHLDKGGIAFYTVNLARYLKLLGVDVSVLSAGGELEYVLDKEGISHIELAIKTKSELGMKVWRALPAAVRYVRKENFDIIHAQTRVTQVMAEAMRKITGTPYVTTCHGFFKHRRLSRRVLPCWGEKVIAISESVRSHLVSDMKVENKKAVLVYNGIDLKSYENLSGENRLEILKELGISEDSAVVGTVGRFSSVKGLKYLIEAFDMTSAKRKDISLLLIGQGPEEESLKHRASQSASCGRIFFSTGIRPLREYLSVMDIFCMPSLGEGFGLAAVEAMASGKPCIVSKVGGLTEIITDGENGIVVPPAEPAALERAILRVLGDKVLADKLSFQAKKRALDFSLERCGAGTLKVYQDVLAEREKAKVN